MTRIENIANECFAFLGVLSLTLELRRSAI